MSSNVYRTNSSDRHEAITPSDSVDLPQVARGLYVGGAGDVVLVDDKGTTTTFTGLLAGVVYPFVYTRVNSTSTTATNLVALY